MKIGFDNNKYLKISVSVSTSSVISSTSNLAENCSMTTTHPGFFRALHLTASCGCFCS